MNKWSGRQNNGNHSIKTADRKTNENNESNEQDLWDNMKCANLHIIQVRGGEEREKGIENEKMYLKKLWLKTSQT